MITNIEFDSSYATVFPYNMSGNFLHYLLPGQEWQKRFILYDNHDMDNRLARMEWLDDLRKILYFEHLDAVGNQLGRIQIQNTIDSSPVEIEEERRMRIHFENPTNNWLVLWELWCGAQWAGDDYGFRISMGYQGNEAFFYADKQDANGNYEPAWQSGTFEIPVGEWFDMYIRLIAGENGTFQVATKAPGGIYQRVVDINDAMYNTDSPEIQYPTFTNPLMLYLGADTIRSILQSDQKCRVDLRTFTQWLEL